MCIQKVLLLCMAAAEEMAIGKAAGGDAARIAAAGKAALHGGGWRDDIMKVAAGEAARIAAAGKAAGEMAIRKAAGGEASRIAAAGKVAMHGGSWRVGDWEGGGRLEKRRLRRRLCIAAGR